MPCDLTNALAVFQALMNDVLRDFLNHFTFVYLDNILIFSHTSNKHTLHIHQGQQQLLENGLFVKAEKCEFHDRLVTFMEYIIKSRQVSADPKKIRAVTKWPSPSTLKQLQWFQVRKLLPLLHQGLQLGSGTSHQAHFHLHLTLFTSTPVIIQSDPLQQFIVEVDASDFG